MWHDIGSTVGVLMSTGDFQLGSHPANPEPTRRIKNQFDAYGITDNTVPLPVEAATTDTLLRFHTEKYVQRVVSLSAGRGGETGDSAIAGPGTDAIARLAVGAACGAVEATLKGTVDNAYVLTRPCGHHAERDQGRGFCIYGNAALAIMEAQAKGLVGRVAVVDWDVHHGNGTQQAFYDRDDVLTISIHEEMLYPFDIGTHEEHGEGAGIGFNINVPLPAGSGGGAYMAAMERVVLPALQRFNPDLIVIANGLDASYFDPMSHILLVSGHYREMTKLLMQASRELCGGKLVALQEGGYSDFYLPFCASAIAEEMIGLGPTFEDPADALALLENQLLKSNQSAYLDAAVEGPLARFFAAS